MKLFNKASYSSIVVASIYGQQCRVSYFSKEEDQLSLAGSKQFLFTDIDTVKDNFSLCLKDIGAKKTVCRWVLGAEHYQTFSVDAPSVTDAEMAEALKWQVKDLMEKPIDSQLISYYRQSHPDQQKEQITAVAVDKDLIEALIQSTKDANLELDSIEIEELALGNAFVDELSENQITGYVGEYDGGLIFNFYLGDKLCFSRQKKGRYIPVVASEEEFVLDNEQQNEEESFLLETQRTLDYVISQIFRRPLDCILLQQKGEQTNLAETMSQITDTKVSWVTTGIEPNDSGEFLPNLAEAGCARRVIS